MLSLEGSRSLSGKAGQLQAYRLELPTRIWIIRRPIPTTPASWPVWVNFPSIKGNAVSSAADSLTHTPKSQNGGGIGTP